MKHSRFHKLFAFLLAIMLCVTMVTPAFAAKKANSGKSKPSTSQSNPGKGNGKGNGNNKTTDTSDAELTLIEDETTVTEGTQLRASTYALTSADDGIDAQADDTATSTTLKYFPVTMYNYDKTTINNATHQVEVDNGLGSTWDGIYFNNGSPAAESYSEEIAIEDGTYIIQNARAAANSVGSWLVGDTSGITSTTNQSDATRWTVKSNGDGTYTLNSTNGYMTIGSGQDGEKTATTASNIEIVGYTGSTYTGCVQLESNGYYLCQWGGNKVTVYGGYDQNNNAGNAFYFYKVTDSGTEKITFPTAGSRSYEAWNWWNKNNGSNSYGQYTYSGLVESTLTANKDITFTKPDGGIFNSDATVKQIYTGVEMPFVYKDGTYTFDASQNAVYFHEDEGQSSTAVQSNGRLYFDEGKQQTWNTIEFGDGSNNVWAPFDDGVILTGNKNEGDMDYHFGMRTTIPFTMTANGKINPNDDTSKDITFSFSGDDDVWVFIDGQLVLDIGGIHNRLDATINFAENTWELSESNSAKVNNVHPQIGDMNNAALEGKLFNDGDTTGTLNQTRETFAATDRHELTIFYLERGAGSSNCKIEFNLPMKDTVSVQKLVNETDSAGMALDADTLAQINARDFGFTLYKDGTPVANTNYSLLNENGQYIATASTDANGHFTLKNKQTAKFVGTISTKGNTYYAIEDKDADADDFWTVPTWTYTADPASSATEQTTNVNNGESMRVTVTGADESEEHLSFVCKNTWVHQDNTSINAVDDKIVIDYGLPVEIDVLANDVVSNGTKSITEVTDAEYGTATIENGKIKYQLTKQLTGVEVLNYTVKATATSGVESDNKTATAKVYIIPATTMYYEENFSNMVTFNNGKSAEGWKAVGTAQTAPQEPGVVGTVGDSPYGSDVAYLNDSGDSNGSSMYVDTTAGAASFSYTFTGTGTSFFARTSGTAAYMRVVIKDSDGETIYTGFRKNIYKSVEGTDVGTLYNVPVFTYEAENYGTYTVTVTLAKANADMDYGKDFYLDGIRVVKPLNATDANVSVANSAYATDGEANMTVETLRNKLIGEASIGEDGTLQWNGKDFVIFTDTNGKITTVEEYTSNGPKEEVYLNNGQSVTFSLKNWDANTNKIYLGIKAPVGSGTVSINGNTLNINNATDCYYDISSYADITTDEDGVKIATFEVKATSSLISVTNIKVTGNAKFTIVNQDDEKISGGEGSDESGDDIDATGN